MGPIVSRIAHSTGDPRAVPHGAAQDPQPQFPNALAFFGNRKIETRAITLS